MLKSITSESGRVPGSHAKTQTVTLWCFAHSAWLNPKRRDPAHIEHLAKGLGSLEAPVESALHCGGLKDSGPQQLKIAES